MDRELNPRSEMQRASEKALEKLKKEGPPPNPGTPEREKDLKLFEEDPVAYFKKAYLEQEFEKQGDLKVLELLLLARIVKALEKLP